LSESQHNREEPLDRAASLIAKALAELQRNAAGDNSVAGLHEELAASRAAIEALAARFDRQMADELEQRLLLAGQLTNLATSLDRLVNHLEGLSEVIAGLAGHPASSQTAAAKTHAPVEPAFMPGGEGVTLSILAVPGFQVLMDIQKALNALDAVGSASVERFQEGDSRVLVHLRSPVTAAALASALHGGTNLHFAVEEARPELMSLRLKVVETSL
jgi:hypothetical protein